MQFLLLLNNLLLQTADLLFEVFNLTLLFTVRMQLCVEFKTEEDSILTSQMHLSVVILKGHKILGRTALILIGVTPLHVTLEEKGIEEGLTTAWTLNGEKNEIFYILIFLFIKRNHSQNMQKTKQMMSGASFLFDFTV